MTVTRQSLADHFGLLGDDELLEQFQSGELTDLAESVAAEELRSREIDPSKREAEPPKSPVEPQAGSEATSSSEDLVLVARVNNAASAYLLQSRLDAEGVPTVVADALAFQNMPFGAGVGGVRILVPESYFERAAQIKKQIDRGDFALDDKTDVG